MKEQKSNSKTYELLSCGETSGKIAGKSTLTKELLCLCCLGAKLPRFADLNERQDDLPRHQKRPFRIVRPAAIPIHEIDGPR